MSTPETLARSIGTTGEAFAAMGEAAERAGESIARLGIILAEYDLDTTPRWRVLARWWRGRKLAKLRAAWLRGHLAGMEVAS